MFKPHSFACAVVLVICGTSPLRAQSLFGSRGPASQIGTNSVGSFAGRGTTLGTSVTSGLGTLGTRGGSLTGGLTTGLSTPGGLAIGTGTGTGAGQPGRASGFVGRDDNAGRFVGDQRLGQQLGRTFSSTRRFDTRGTGTRGGRLGFRPSGLPAATVTQLRFRPQQRIAFQYPAPRPRQLSATVEQRLRMLSRRGRPLAGLQVQVDQSGTVVLQGQVASEEARKLAVALVRLEPGVRRVVDRLQVKPSR